MFAGHKLRRSGLTPSIENWVKRGSFSTASNSSINTHTNADIGDAGVDRVVLLAIGYADGTERALASVVIGGVTATIEQVIVLFTGAAFAWATVPSGTTADIVTTFDGSDNQRSYYHQVFTFNWSDFSVLQVQTEKSNAASVTAVDQNCVDGGLVVSSRGDYLTDANFTQFWSGIDALVAEVDNVFYGDSNVRMLSMGRVLTTEDSAIRDYTITRTSGGSSEAQMLTVSFGVI